MQAPCFSLKTGSGFALIMGRPSARPLTVQAYRPEYSLNKLRAGGHPTIESSGQQTDTLFWSRLQKRVLQAPNHIVADSVRTDILTHRSVFFSHRLQNTFHCLRRRGK